MEWPEDNLVCERAREKERSLVHFETENQSSTLSIRVCLFLRRIILSFMILILHDRVSTPNNFFFFFFFFVPSE